MWSKVVKDDSFNPNMMNIDGMSDNIYIYIYIDTHTPCFYFILNNK